MSFSPLVNQCLSIVYSTISWVSFWLLFYPPPFFFSSNTWLEKKYKSCPKFVFSTYIVFSTNKKIAISEKKKNFPEFPFDYFSILLLFSFFFFFLFFIFFLHFKLYICCRSLRQSRFYSFIWTHKIQFLKNKIFSNPKKKKDIINKF